MNILTKSDRPLKSALSSGEATSDHVVEAKAVRKSFGELEVLKGVDLQVDPGEVFFIVGPSGSGKSTFLRCINHLEVIDGGSLLVNGRPVGYRQEGKRLYELNRRDVGRRRQDIGMVFQDFNLFGHMTALENVTAAPMWVKRKPAREARRHGRELLEQVGLGDKADTYPAKLSGGQQQRVAIARALAMEPNLMLLDEPTSALDPELVGEVLVVIRDLAASGMTMVVVTHEIAFAREVGSSLVVMADGAIIEQGPPEGVVSNPTTDRAADFFRRIL